MAKLGNYPKKYNLDGRWYSPIAEIVLFSSVNNLFPDISCWVSKNYDKDKLISSPSITISVHGDISRDRLTKWVSENWETFRQEAQSQQVIKKISGIPSVDFIDIDQQIILLHEREGLNPTQISNKLSEKYQENIKLSDALSNSQMVAQRLRRYKKLFNLE